MPKRPKRKATKPPPTKRAGRPAASGRSRTPKVSRSAVVSPSVGSAVLQYKVVELSTVDEGALEGTLNEWCSKGWNFDGVQFAMRDSSKRPAMAFVFFTRPGEPAEVDDESAKRRLAALADEENPHAEYQPRVDPWVRLAQLAGEDT